MKELTIEQKAKRYDEALEKAKQFHDRDLFAECNGNLVEYIFPELKESKDEKIMEEIKVVLANIDLSQFALDYTFADMIAWLEKQGEQKSADKVEPKFHEGEWVVNTVGDTNQVVKVLDDGYTLDDNTFLSNSWATEHYHLYTIQDAKAGDVLAVTMYPEGTWIGIFKEHDGCTFSSYCFRNTEGTFKLGTYNHGYGKAIHPATKEQRDVLMKAMADAGYTFYFEKKELRKLKFRVGDEIKTINEESLTITKIDEKGYWSGDLFICNFDDVDKWKLIEQKTAEWREEDEQAIKDAETWLDTLCDYLKDSSSECIPDIKDVINKLKSLRPHNRWKPSEEQIQALDEVYKTHGANNVCRRIIFNLMNDLKQLKQL